MSEVVRVRVNDDANDELEVSVEDVRKAVKKLKKGKSPGVDGIFFFFFYEWEHRTGTMCPFSSLYPSRNGKE